MDNIDKFTTILNSCSDPLRVYNALRAITETPFEQSDNVREELQKRVQEITKSH